MKKNSLKLILILIAVTFVSFQSCEKKEFSDNENVINENIMYKLPNNLVSNIENINGILHFQSIKSSHYFYFAYNNIKQYGLTIIW